MSAKPARPVLRWHGGKWLLAPWIIENLPPHRVYVEPYGGAASVLLRKSRSYAEVYNDLDDDVVSMFEVLRGPRAADLVASLRLTPYARTEFALAYKKTSDPIERARRLVIRSFMGFGSDGHNGARPTGFRATSTRLGTTPAHDWVNYPDHLEAIIRRLSGVVIENRPAIEVMRQNDTAETLFYVDPPYVHSTRSKPQNSARKNYTHEMDDADHGALLAYLGTVLGKVVISGYPHPLYDDTLRGWRRIEREALADGARPRTEVLWLNEAATEPTLFSPRPLSDRSPLATEMGDAGMNK